MSERTVLVVTNQTMKALKAEEMLSYKDGVPYVGDQEVVAAADMLDGLGFGCVAAIVDDDVNFTSDELYQDRVNEERRFKVLNEDEPRRPRRQKGRNQRWWEARS